MNAHEIAADIGAVQSAIATGELNGQTAQEELNRIRRKALGLSGNQVEEEVVHGYRLDAIAQVLMLVELVNSLDMHTVPDSTLLHLSACADMFSGKMLTYFKVRNHKVIESLQRGEEVDNG